MRFRSAQPSTKLLLQPCPSPVLDSQSVKVWRPHSSVRLGCCCTSYPFASHVAVSFFRHAIIIIAGELNRAAARQTKTRITFITNAQNVSAAFLLSTRNKIYSVLRLSRGQAIYSPLSRPTIIIMMMAFWPQQESQVASLSGRRRIAKSRASK